MSEEQITYGYSLNIQKKILGMLIYEHQAYLQNSEFIRPEFFDNEILSAIVKIINDFFDQYKKVPTQDELVEEIMTLLESDKRLNKNEFASVLEEVLIVGAKGDFDYVRDKARDFAVYQGVKNAMRTGAEKHLKKKNYEKIVTGIRDAMMIGADAADLGVEYFDNLENRLHRREEGGVRSANAIKTFLNSLDSKMGGGLAPPEVGLLMGPFKRGKTLTIVNFGANATYDGHNVIHYGLEGSKEKTETLYDAKISGVSKMDIESSVTAVRKKAIKEVEKKVKEWFGNPSVGRLRIKHFPTGTGTVLKIEQHMQQLKIMTGFEPKLILIDYLGLMKASDRNLKVDASATGKYHLLGVITKELLSLAQRYGIAIWVLHQSTKASLKKMRVDLDDTADSAEVIRDVDVIVTLNQTKEEEEKDPQEMRLWIAGGRDQAKGEVRVCVDKAKVNVWEKGFKK
jgi:replicative DNA helicase